MGNVTEKVEPLPSWLSTLIAPWRTTISRVIYRPMPSPGMYFLSSPQVCARHIGESEWLRICFL